MFLRSGLHPASRSILVLWLWPFWADKWRAVNPACKRFMVWKCMDTDDIYQSSQSSINNHWQNKNRLHDLKLISFIGFQVILFFWWKIDRAIYIQEKVSCSYCELAYTLSLICSVSYEVCNFMLHAIGSFEDWRHSLMCNQWLSLPC